MLIFVPTWRSCPGTSGPTLATCTRGTRQQEWQILWLTPLWPHSYLRWYPHHLLICCHNYPCHILNFIQVVARHGEPADVICAKEPFLMTQATFSISCLGFNYQAGQKGHPDLLVSCLTCSFSPRLDSLQLPLTILRYTNTCRLIQPIQLERKF